MGTAHLISDLFALLSLSVETHDWISAFAEKDHINVFPTSIKTTLWQVIYENPTSFAGQRSKIRWFQLLRTLGLQYMESWQRHVPEKSLVSGRPEASSFMLVILHSKIKLKFRRPTWVPSEGSTPSDLPSDWLLPPFQRLHYSFFFIFIFLNTVQLQVPIPPLLPGTLRPVTQSYQSWVKDLEERDPKRRRESQRYPHTPWEESHNKSTELTMITYRQRT